MQIYRRYTKIYTHRTDWSTCTTKLVDGGDFVRQRLLSIDFDEIFNTLKTFCKRTDSDSVSANHCVRLQIMKFVAQWHHNLRMHGGLEICRNEEDCDNV